MQVSKFFEFLTETANFDLSGSKASGRDFGLQVVPKKISLKKLVLLMTVQLVDWWGGGMVGLTYGRTVMRMTGG
jgi:hypothetical protein